MSPLLKMDLPSSKSHLCDTTTAVSTLTRNPRPAPEDLPWKTTQVVLQESPVFHRDHHTHDAFSDPYRFRPRIGDDVAIIGPLNRWRDLQGSAAVPLQLGQLE